MSGGRAGYVYLLSNPSMPGLVKIGRTSRDPATRAGELTSASGVPTPFRLEGYVRTPDAARTEASVHRIIGGDRVNKRREFFRTDIPRGLAVLAEVARSERLRLDRPGRRSPAFHLPLLFIWLNIGLYLAGLDFRSVWQPAAANAAVALLVPHRVVSRILRTASNHPLPVHAACGTVSFAVGAAWHPGILQTLRAIIPL